MKRKILTIASSLILLSSCAATTTSAGTVIYNGTMVILYNANGSIIKKFPNASLDSFDNIVYQDEDGNHRIVVKTGFVEEIIYE